MTLPIVPGHTIPARPGELPDVRHADEAWGDLRHSARIVFSDGVLHASDYSASEWAAIASAATYVGVGSRMHALELASLLADHARQVESE